MYGAMKGGVGASHCVEDMVRRIISANASIELRAVCSGRMGIKSLTLRIITGLHSFHWTGRQYHSSYIVQLQTNTSHPLATVALLRPARTHGKILSQSSQVKK
jgi:hypothetical protein